jgi:hypothetical protein
MKADSRLPKNPFPPGTTTDLCPEIKCAWETALTSNLHKQDWRRISGSIIAGHKFDVKKKHNKRYVFAVWSTRCGGVDLWSSLIPVFQASL